MTQNLVSGVDDEDSVHHKFCRFVTRPIIISRNVYKVTTNLCSFCKLSHGRSTNTYYFKLSVFPITKQAVSHTGGRYIVRQQQVHGTCRAAARLVPLVS